MSSIERDLNEYLFYEFGEEDDLVIGFRDMAVHAAADRKH